MDLNEIAVFIQVVREGSFTKAAKKLGMPNSTVSSKISSLEERLGTTLIQRTTRKLNVTPAGQSYFKHCLQGLETFQAAELELASVRGEPQGLFRITAPLELGGGGVLSDIISDFSEKYPKVTVEVIFNDRCMDLLAESVDLAIRAGDLEDSSLIAKKIGTVYFAPFASPRYLKERGKPEHPRDLRNHDCLLFTPLGIEEWELVGPRGTLNVPVPGRILGNDMNTMKKLALNGDGIVLLPAHFCHEEIRNGKLTRILPEWRSNTSPVHFVYPAQKFVTPKLSAFIDFAMEPLKKSFEVRVE